MLRVARNTGRGDEASDLLCRKGSASASRWRAYDHKDTFEPPQAPTAPPSDAEELGSWQKYDGAPPAPKSSAKTVSDDEPPTSWSKYETRPIASLLGSIENRLAQSQLAEESAAPAPPAVPAAPAVVETDPEPDYPVAPLTPDATLALEVPGVAMKPTPAAEIEQEAPATLADPVIVAAPGTETASSAGPVTEATFEPPLPQIDSPDLAVTSAEDDDRELPTSAPPAAAELEKSEPCLPPQDPISALVPAGEQGPALAAVAAPEAPAVADKPPRDEPAMVPEVTGFADPAIKALDEDPSGEFAAPTPTPEAAPLAPQDAVAAAERTVKGPVPDKKAMLARLADMLEQALSAKRSQIVDAAPAAALVPEPAPAIETPLAIVPVTASDLSSDAEELTAATTEAIDAEVPTTDHAPAVESEVPFAAPPQETPAEVTASEDDRGQSAEIEMATSAPIEAVALARAAPTTVDPVVEERPITPEAPLAASLEQDIELPAAHLDPIEISKPPTSPAFMEAAASELSITPPSPEASHDIAAPADELDHPDEAEAGTEAPVAAAAETDPPVTPVDPTGQDASQPDLAPEGATVKAPKPARKAMLARLAEMLERALSARPASAAAKPSASPEPEPMVSSSIAEDMAPMATEAQIPVAELSAKPVAMEVPPALAEPTELVVPFLAADYVNLPEPVDAGGDPNTRTDLPPRESSELETDFPLESVPETTPPLQHARLEEFHDPEAAVAHDVTRDETTTTLPLSGEVTEPAAAHANLAPSEEQATPTAPSLGHGTTTDTPPAPTLEIVADPEPPQIHPEVEESAIASESMPAFGLGEPSTPVEESLTEAVAVAHDASPEQVHDVSHPAREPEHPTDAASAAPEPSALEPVNFDAIDLSAPAATSPAIEEAREIAVMAAETSAEPVGELVAALDAPALEQERDAPGPVPAPAPSLDAVPAPVALEPEKPVAIDASALAAAIPTIEVPEPIIGSTEVSAEPIVEVVAPVEGTAMEAPSAPEAAMPQAAASSPLTPAQQEKAARAELTDDLADVIHNVLRTTQFASRAMKPKRYTEEPRTDAPELPELAEELAASLPHPVAIPPRFGRMERGLAFASIAMLLAIGYFAFSLWQGAGSPSAHAAAQVPAMAIAAPHSEDWGERARDMTRELNSIAVVRDALRAPAPGAAATAGTRPQGPETAE